MKICVDPGHGGRDPGAVNDDLYEKDITLSIVKKLRNILRYWNYDTVITRASDRFVSLNERVETAKINKADALVSVHANAVGNPDVTGIETYHWPMTSVGSDKLANCVQGKLIENMRRNDRGVKQARFKVLSVSGMPAILVEVGFISNPEKYKLFKEDYYNFMKAFSIAEGIELYEKEV